LLDLTSLNYSGLQTPQTAVDFTTAQLKAAGWHGRIILVKITCVIFLAIAIIVAAGGVFLIMDPEGRDLILLAVILFVFAMALGTVAWFAPKLTLKLRGNQLALLRFAIDNGADYYTSEWPARHDERIKNVLFGQNILQRSYPGTINNVLIFPDNTLLFQYNYMTGNNQQKFGIEQNAQIVCLKLPVSLPRIFLNSRRNILNFMVPTDKMQEVSLEGDFSSYFRVYFTPGSQITTLQILTPDVMAALLDFGFDYDFEILDNNLYIYAPANGLDFISPVKLQKLLQNLNNVQNKILRQLQNYQTETASSDKS